MFVASSRGRRHPGRGKLATQCLLQSSRESFSVFNRFGPNLVHLLGVPEEDHPPTLKKIQQPPSGFQRLKAKNDQEDLHWCWLNLQGICIYVSFNFAEKFGENLIKHEKVVKDYVFTSITMFVDFFSGRSDTWQCDCELTCTLDNESPPIFVICPYDSKMIEIVSLSDILKFFIFESMRIQFD